MHISIDTTQELSALDLRVLAALVGETAVSAPSKATAKPEATDDEVAAEKPAPARKAPAKKAAAKKPEPEPEPEPDEDEPVDEDETDDDDLLGGDDEEITMDDAVALATELVSDGKAAEVKKALAAVGAKRVSELKGSNIAKFVTSLRD